MLFKFSSLLYSFIEVYFRHNIFKAYNLMSFDIRIHSWSQLQWRRWTWPSSPKLPLVSLRSPALPTPVFQAITKSHSTDYMLHFFFMRSDSFCSTWLILIHIALSLTPLLFKGHTTIYLFTLIDNGLFAIIKLPWTFIKKKPQQQKANISQL